MRPPALLGAVPVVQAKQESTLRSPAALLVAMSTTRPGAARWSGRSSGPAPRSPRFAGRASLPAMGSSARESRAAATPVIMRSSEARHCPFTPTRATPAWGLLRCKSGSAGAESPLSRLRLVQGRLAPRASGWLDPAVDLDSGPSAEMRACGRGRGTRRSVNAAPWIVWDRCTPIRLVPDPG
jgi:hypothetical protein